MKVRMVWMFVLAALLLSSTSAMGQNPVSAVPAEEEIQELLRDYSTSLVTGQVTKDAYYSPAMMDLLQERRSFYDEFFAVGLHSDLLSLESNFNVESITRTAEQGDLYTVHAVEMVTLRGKYQCSSPEEYPLVRSGRWALVRTADPAVQKDIEGYIESMVEGITQSIKEESFETVFIVRHELMMADVKEGLKILQDSFSDAANDDVEGFDNVSWVQDAFVRHISDLTRMPDYVMYHSSIEELGQSLLDAYTGMHSTRAASLPLSILYTYSHTAAAGYALTWVAPTDLKCSTDPDVYQDQNNWNPAYHKNPCNDCANFVSQALKRGGHPTTATWYVSQSCSDWNNVDHLKGFLLDELRGYPTLNYLNLQVGDLAFKMTVPKHVVIVTQVGPHTISSHTSDRENYPFYGALDYYMIICSTRCPT